jgi:hypothetical protein
MRHRMPGGSVLSGITCYCSGVRRGGQLPQLPALMAFHLMAARHLQETWSTYLSYGASASKNPARVHSCSSARRFWHCQSGGVFRDSLPFPNHSGDHDGPRPGAGYRLGPR